jgi:hypothetical protein
MMPPNTFDGGVGLILERRRHPEVAAPAPYRPEQVGVLVGASGADLTVGCDEFD